MGAPETSAPAARFVGRHRVGEAGPKLIVTTLMHGNEPAGADAARRVLEELGRGHIDFDGELVVLVGNTRAAAAGVRYLSKDLNRQWTSERLTAVRSGTSAAGLDPEDEELGELLDVVESEYDPSRTCFFLDLHTTSAEGGAFILFGDTLRNRVFGTPIPLTTILGLEEQLDGTLLEHMTGLGCVSMACEGGQHDDPNSVLNHEAVLWLALASAGMVGSDEPLLSEKRAHLERVRGELPRIIQVRYRHPVQPADRFRMRPGFENLTPVDVGTLLARDRDGEIRARWDAWLLMPLYQGQGQDGFFLALTVRPAWLKVSAFLRRLRLSSLVRILPGVRRHPEKIDTLVVDTKVARWFPLDIFHLFGYRKVRWQGSILLVSRRRHDTKAPRTPHAPKG